jgi:hypothetical protein
MAQVVEHLPSKPKALSSNPSTTKKKSTPYLAGHWWLTPVILIERLKSGRSLGKANLRDPISKINRAKWTGGVAQMVERLLCKCEALRSNSPPQKKKGKYLWHVFSPMWNLEDQKETQK